MNKRIFWVDYAKAIGIFLVVFGHVLRGIYNSGILIDKSIFFIIDRIIYSFHMPLFFVLSGLFFYGSFIKRGAIGLIKSKVDSIVYPYVLWSIIQGVIVASLSKFTNGNATYYDILKILWLPQAQFWFLYALFIMFLISSILCTIFPIKTATLFFITSIMIYIFSDSFLYSYILSLFYNYSVFFAFGCFLSFLPKKEIIGSNFLLIFLSILFLILQYLFSYELTPSIICNRLYSLTIAFISILFIISLSRRLSKRHNKYLLLLGKSSMAIYLMHIIISSGIRIALLKIFKIDNFVLHLILGISFGLFLPAIFDDYLKKKNFYYLFSAPISSFF